MWQWETNISEMRNSLRGGKARMSPKSNSSARRSNRKSTNNPGSPNGSLTSAGCNMGRISVEQNFACPRQGRLQARRQDFTRLVKINPAPLVVLRPPQFRRDRQDDRLL